MTVHSADCDGWATIHAHEVRYEGPFTQRGRMRRLVCVDCGSISYLVGPDVSDESLRTMIGCKTESVQCTGQCIGSNIWYVRIDRHNTDNGDTEGTRTYKGPLPIEQARAEADAWRQAFPDYDTAVLYADDETKDDVAAWTKATRLATGRYRPAAESKEQET